jgi:GDP-L-fucose synthase
VWGDGSQRREFLHVSDAAKAIVLATELYDESEPVNVGTGKDISIKNVVSLITKIMGYKGKIVWDVSKPSGYHRKNFDVSKAKIKFNFVATKEFEKGLKETIEWYRNHIKIRKEIT